MGIDTSPPYHVLVTVGGAIWVSEHDYMGDFPLILSARRSYDLNPPGGDEGEGLLF
jgi:hypothetical protein